jgi:pimeloyl-ACP methyl ester carboxylesterase
MPTITTSDGVGLHYIDSGAPAVLLATAESNLLATAVVLDDCGHAADFDQPDAVNAALLGFLDKL